MRDIRKVAKEGYFILKLNLCLQETNGGQYDKNRDKMIYYHPKANAAWIKTQIGVYHTVESFYQKSAGIFEGSTHYEALME